MKIWAHSESRIVELNDGSRWQIFPGDLDLTLNWNPETEISVALAEDNVGSQFWSAPAPSCGSSRRRKLAHLTSEDINIKDMAMEDRETFNLIGSDIVEGTNEYEPDGQRSVTSSVS